MLTTPRLNFCAATSLRVRRPGRETARPPARWRRSWTNHKTLTAIGGQQDLLYGRLVNPRKSKPMHLLARVDVGDLGRNRAVLHADHRGDLIGLRQVRRWLAEVPHLDTAVLDGSPPTVGVVARRVALSVRRRWRAYRQSNARRRAGGRVLRNGRVKGYRRARRAARGSIRRQRLCEDAQAARPAHPIARITGSPVALATELLQPGNQCACERR